MACRYKRDQTATLNKTKTYGGKIIPAGTKGQIISAQPDFGCYYIKFVALNGPVMISDSDLA